MLTPGKEYAYARKVLLQDLNMIDEEKEDMEESEEKADEEEELDEDEHNTTLKAEIDGEEENVDTETQGSRIEYFGTDGKMRTLWQTISGAKYYFGTDGRMSTG